MLRFQTRKSSPIKNQYQLDHRLVPRIFELIRSHDNEAAKAHLVQHPEETHLKGWMSNTPLHEACNSGNLEMVKYLASSPSWSINLLDADF